MNSNSNYKRYKDNYLTVYAKDSWGGGSIWEKILDEVREENGLEKNADAVKICILESGLSRKLIDKMEFAIAKEAKI